MNDMWIWWIMSIPFHVPLPRGKHQSTTARGAGIHRVGRITEPVETQGIGGTRRHQNFAREVLQ